MSISRHEFLKLGASSLGLAALGIPSRANASVTPTDALQRHALAVLNEYTAWLPNGGLSGYVGEFAVPNNEDGQRPDIPQWVAFLDKFYSWMDERDFWATYYGVAHSRGGGDSDPGSVWHAYSPTDLNYNTYGYGERTLGEAQEQAQAIEAHLGYKLLTGERVRRGVNIADGYHAWNSDFSNESPGIYGSDYRYAGYDSLAYLKSRNIATIRLLFLWERVQPEPFGPLREVEIDRIKRELSYMDEIGMVAILDVHNFGLYQFPDANVPLGSARLPTDALADLWGKLSYEFKNHPRVAGYDLMNEPGLRGAGLPGGAPTWERASQLTVDKIRANEDRKRIMVSNYFNGGGMSNVVEKHPRPWIEDSADNFKYTTHIYFSGDKMTATYDEMVAYWQQRGY